ncbi:uncharacterized mitochondrial protein AtMg00860-like [Nicotiana sylvestris]|uniref:uncharacterized mitochondrial protein AtMg00860-like n=1 Tax=Nicotiana sylvestris TaxID=4096 RepID=UPI00388CEA10
MNPDNLQLAKKECEELLEFDLIEPSDSQWACKAFYANKRDEQTRRKLSPGPYICHELVKFPDTNLTTNQIQQFLGIVNYVRDFIPNISTYISPLTEMLNKNAPPWGKKQDKEIKEIKEISKNVKSIYIPSDSKKILQTDASNEYWSAVLF